MSNSDHKGTIENLMVTQRGLILLLTNREIKWSSGIFESYSDILTISDFQQAAKMLNNLRCDLLIIDAETLKDQTLSAVKEFKRNFPYRPVGILLDDTSDSTENLLSVGTDLILHPNLSSEEIEQQIRIVLNQNTARRAIVADIERLHVVSSLPVLLRDLTNTEQIYLHA